MFVFVLSCVWILVDRVRKMYQMFPQISVPQHVKDNVDDNELHKLTETITATKTRVEGCSSFLKAALR